MNTSTVGLIGELKVQRLLNVCKLQMGAQYISNLPLYDSDKNTYNQVDDVVICTRGFFAIEVKNWNCEVNCEDSRYWKVKYPKQEIYVKSPLDQNTAHCRKLEKITGCMPINIVLFVDGARLKGPPDGIMLASEFPSYLARYPEIISQSEAEDLYNRLVDYKRSIEPRMIMEFIVRRAKI